VAQALPDGESSTRRLTLMIGWWRRGVRVGATTDGLGPNMIPPWQCTPKENPGWAHDLRPCRSATAPSRGYRVAVSTMHKVWEDIMPTSQATKPLPAVQDVEFFGRWFVRSDSQIDEEILGSASTKNVHGKAEGSDEDSSDGIEFMSLEDAKRISL